MIKIPRSQSTTIKEMIYPKPTVNPKYQKRNNKYIKNIQVVNRIKKEKSSLNYWKQEKRCALLVADKSFQKESPSIDCPQSSLQYQPQTQLA